MNTSRNWTGYQWDEVPINVLALQYLKLLKINAQHIMSAVLTLAEI